LPSWNLRKAIEHAWAKKENATILPVPIIGAVRKSLEVTMKGFVKILVAVCAVLMSVTSCNVAMKEMEFAKSRYGVEMLSMMNVCAAMQRNGNLPGIRGGADRTIEFGSEEMDFSKKDDVVYPLQMQCTVTKDGKTRAFTFNKAKAGADWMLVR